MRVNLQLFMNKVVITEAEGCWEWQGYLDKDGYGIFQHMRAHRVSYQLFVGPIPKGEELDHFYCENRKCVNPWHVMPATHVENVQRTKITDKTHCKHGHMFSKENTYVDNKGVRHCRTCSKLRARRYRSV